MEYVDHGVERTVVLGPFSGDGIERLKRGASQNIVDAPLSEHRHRTRYIPLPRPS